MNVLKRWMLKFRHFFLSPLISSNEDLADLLLHRMWSESIQEPKNPLNRYGAKYFSQSDEDGITLEILRRIGLKEGTFAELGVGNGSENNTIILLALRWKGIWIGNEELFFQYDKNLRRFAFLKRWIERENIVALLREGLGKLGSQAFDVVALDLDMHDIYFVEELLTNSIRPKLFIVEYNGKFPPPIRWHVGYDPTQRWQGDDYQGASLQSFHDLFTAHGYMLVCCNAFTGVNAFFVLNEYKDKFADVPSDIGDIFYRARLFLNKQPRHQQSPKTIERMLQLNEGDVD
jgi:hypothetical protein